MIPYNPLAEGLLTRKYTHGDTPQTGRFSAELGGFGQAYHAHGMIGSSMCIRVVSTVLGEKLGVVKSSHSRQRPTSVPFPADTTGQLSTSATIAANTLDASRFVPRTVRSTETLRPVAGSLPA